MRKVVAKLRRLAQPHLGSDVPLQCAAWQPQNVSAPFSPLNCSRNQHIRTELNGIVLRHTEKIMPGAAVYGFFIAIGFVTFTRVAPQPGSSVIWWSSCALQLTRNSTICWRRTGLPFALAGMGISAIVSVLLAILATEGHVFPDLPFEWWVPVAVVMILGPVSLFIESRVHRTQWAR
jgi:hypothetical protein